MVPPTLRSYFQQHNIAFEAIDTVSDVSCGVGLQFAGLCIDERLVYTYTWSILKHVCLQANAVSTFNILNQEGRKVAGCLLPAGAN